MSRYIRTKDGVYLKIRECDENNKILIVGKTVTDFGTYIEKKDIINQSENLEELCDMFVCGGTGFEMPSEMPLSHTTQYQKMKILIKFGMIGGLDVWLKLGIWTSKGLIYVAKMNSEGKLVLI